MRDSAVRSYKYHARKTTSARKDNNNGLASHHETYERVFISFAARLEEIGQAMLDKREVLYQGENR